MEKKMILLFGVVFILASVFVMAFSGVGFSGRSINELEKNYSYTRAICNFSNECQDFLIVCENGLIASLESVSDVVKFGKDWKDFRKKEELC